MSTSKVNMSLDDIIKSHRQGGRDRRGRGGRESRGRGRGNRGRGGRGNRDSRDFPRRAYGERRNYSRTSDKGGSTRLVVNDLPENISNKDLRVHL
jgi:hypothetical protein